MSARRQIGPYRVVRPLGQGGMGAVYLARDVRLDRDVALKLFSGPESRGGFARDDLLNEARAAAAINHPHIASVHDVLDDNGQVAIVFEYVEGETLAERLQRGRIEWPEALRLAQQLADALAAAHQHGIVHRDLKPANIVITPDGNVKVLDFGVARVMREGADDAGGARTTAAGFVGTIGYAAPEQCLGQGVDARADIFSFGVVLFEMLTSRRPFAAGDSPSVVRAMLQGEPPRVRTLVGGVPSALEALVSRMLAVDPASRPATVRELRGALQAIGPLTRVDGLPVHRGRRTWAMAAVALVALVVGGLVGSIPWRPARTVDSEKPPVIAVLPLTNASGDPGKDYLGTGVAENLVTRLASLQSVTVLSRPAVNEVLTRKRDPAALAQELDATYVVHGSVQQVGDRLRIDLRLVEADGSVAWADDVQGGFVEVFDLQSRLTSALIQALDVRISAADRANLAQQPTRDVNALAAYWRGRTLLDRRDIPGNVDAALQAFSEAADRDPRFAEAHAGRGEALWALYLDSKDPSHARAAVDAGTTALRVGPNRAEVRYVLAVTLAGTGQLDAAIEELQRALALSPNFEDARIQLGSVLARLGRTDEAAAEFRKVADRRPNNASALLTMGVALYAAGRYREAAAAFERVAALQPDNVAARQQAGVAYHALGDIDAALVWYHKALAIRQIAQAHSNIGAIHHQRGEFEEAVEAYQRAIAIRPNSRETHRNLGDAYSRLGMKRQALAAYNRAIELTLNDLKVNDRDARSVASLALYFQKAGRSDEARKSINEAVQLAPEDFEVLRRSAQVHALAGREADALADLERAIQRGLRPETVRNEDEFESLRSLAAFQSLTGFVQQ
jgi:serine/threonine-protein kinase